MRDEFRHPRITDFIPISGPTKCRDEISVSSFKIRNNIIGAEFARLAVKVFFKPHVFNCRFEGLLRFPVDPNKRFLAVGSAREAAKEKSRQDVMSFSSHKFIR